MAQSFSHKFGQMLGNILENMIIEDLSLVASNYNMYLDYKHSRQSRNKKKEVIWKDINGNNHKLDIVIEKNGTEEVVGIPKAFIEIAWRRYTKHSKNKVQEISGALLPLAEKYNKFSPFLGVVLAGEFTTASLIQLRSQGFNVLYFNLELILNALAENDLIITWNESTPEEKFQEYISELDSWDNNKFSILKKYLLKELNTEIENFKNNLINNFTRYIETVRITTLYAKEHEVFSVEDAAQYLFSFDERIVDKGEFYKFKIYVGYSNGDGYEGKFQNKIDAISFLKRII